MENFELNIPSEHWLTVKTVTFVSKEFIVGCSKSSLNILASFLCTLA